MKLDQHLPTLSQIKERLRPTQTAYMFVGLAVFLALLQLAILLGTNRFDALMSINGENIYYCVVAFLVAIAAYADNCKLIGRVAMTLSLALLFKILWHPILAALPASPFPIHDVELVAFEHFIGLPVSNLSAWSHAYPLFETFFNNVYDSISVAIILLVIVLPIFDKQFLSRTLYRFVICVISASFIAYLFPVISPDFGYSGAGHYAKDAAGYAKLFFAVRSGSDHYVTYDISLPSFHVIFALLFAKSITDIIKHPLAKIAYLYVMLVAISTITTGWHYLLDIVAAFIVFYLACVMQRFLAGSTSARSVAKPLIGILVAAGLLTSTNSNASSNLDYLPSTVKTFAATNAGKEAVSKLNQAQQQSIHKANAFAASGGLSGTPLSHDQLTNITNIATASKHFVRDKMNALANKMMGKQTHSNTHLYYFLSFSMPVPIMQVYLHDALYDGGTIVFRGIGQKDTKLIQFLNRITGLIGHGIAYPLIEIYPQLFDRYDVNVVPTIVLTTDIETSCIKTQKIEQGLMFKGCQKANPKHYWKVSGLVSSYFALSQFASDGAPANLYLKRLENGGITSLTCNKNIDTRYENLPAPFSRSDVENTLSKFNIHLDRQGRMVGSEGVNVITQKQGQKRK